MGQKFVGLLHPLKSPNPLKPLAGFALTFPLSGRILQASVIPFTHDLARSNSRFTLRLNTRIPPV
jgi:hypothetical protein